MVTIMPPDGYASGNHSSHAGPPINPKLYSFDMKHNSDGYVIDDNVLFKGESCFSNVEEKFTWTVFELQFLNDYLMSQFRDMNELRLETEEIANDGGTLKCGNSLFEGIACLKRELLEEKKARSAAEEALRYLQITFSDAEEKAQQLSEQLHEAQQNMDQEIKVRDNKYSELDSKFSRLHKRAKQRIQEVQKEKEDLDAQLRNVNEASEHASSQLFTVQQELDRTRQQAKEALKAMDSERQQLRSTNNKLNNTVEELHRLLDAKERALAGLELSLLEKEQTVKDQLGLLEVAEEQRQAAVSEISACHQKQTQSLEAQLADALSEKTAATEKISLLQVLVAEKESIIAEMGSASSGEAARLSDAMEAVKAELVQLRNNHEIEKKDWEDSLQSLRTKLDVSECNLINTEIEATKSRSQLETELSMQVQYFKEKDSELLFAKKEIESLTEEFSAYKVRAHALLQKKNTELDAVKDAQQLNALEDALDEAEKRFLLLSEEKDRAIHDLEDVLTNFKKEIASRDATLIQAEQQMKTIQLQLDTTNTLLQSEKEAWDIKLQNVEKTWQMKYEEIKSQKELLSGEYLRKELEQLQVQHKKLKEEHTSFRNLADKLIEQRDKEISNILSENANLRHSIESRSLTNQSDNCSTASEKQDGSYSHNSAAEQQILVLARQQAHREEELAQSQRHIVSLQDEIEELERENRLHRQQESMLKEELRNMERNQKREGVDMTYLKNVVLKLLQTGEVDALLPVIGMLLQFSPDEMQKCQQPYDDPADVPPNSASDGSVSGLSILSRFSFS